MPSPLIDSTHYPQIRAAIDPTLDATVLPDSVLAMDIYVPSAIDMVLDRDPDAETRTGDEQTRAQRAAVYYAAALVAPKLPLVASEQFGSYRYQRQQVDLDKLSQNLLALASDELDAYLSTGTDTDARPTFFAVATASRGT